MFATVEWANGAAVYEVNIRQYTHEGTFNAFKLHLNRLHHMGITILWFMPITPISLEKRQGSKGSYYACSNYTEINEEFGSLNDFKRIVNKAHELGMKVIIDWVANHTGYNHVWVKEHPEWYKKDKYGNFIEEHGWVDVIDLDYSNAALRKAMIQAMQYWIQECDIDGFRCDMAHLVPLDFWQQAREACHKLKSLFWLAECDNTDYLSVFDANYAWEWMHVTENYLHQTSNLDAVRHVMNLYIQPSLSFRKLLFTSNHDENSWNGTEYEKYGNAALGLAVVTFTWPGMPLIYSGQELPNQKRLKFFDKDEIEWGNELPALHEFYQTLILLKKTNAALHWKAHVQWLSTEHNSSVLAYLCSSEKSQVLVIFNCSSQDQLSVTIKNNHIEGLYQNLFSKFEYYFSKQIHFELQAWEFFVYVKQQP